MCDCVCGWVLFGQVADKVVVEDTTYLNDDVEKSMLCPGTDTPVLDSTL